MAARGRGAFGSSAAVALLALLLVGCATGSTTTSPPATPGAAATPATSPSVIPQITVTTQSPGSAPNAGCRSGDPLAGVYHPGRLQVLAACRTTSGVVIGVRSERDGDTHIWMRLDPGQEGLLNSSNHFHGQPALVVEILPQHCFGVPQADAQDNCADRAGYASPGIPFEGDHITVTGPWVLDTLHGWDEIHPVWALRSP